MKKILIGIIGFGNIGKKRFNALTKLKRFAEVKVICEKRSIKEKFKKIDVINDLNKINNYNLDLLIICTPTAISKDQYKQFVGKYHLLIEKPITLDMNDLFRNIKKSLTKKKIIKAGYNLKYDRGLNYIKKKLNSKLIGKIYYSKLCYANGTALSNTNNVGSIFDMASHSVNLLMWLFNTNKFNIINSYNQKNEFSKIYPDNGFAILKFKNILINLHHGFCNWKNIFSFEVYGKKGSLKVYSLPKWGEQTVIYEKRVLPSGNPKIEIKKFKNDLSFKNELHSILDNIKDLNEFRRIDLKKINYECFHTLKNSILLK